MFSGSGFRGTSSRESRVQRFKDQWHWLCDFWGRVGQMDLCGSRGRIVVGMV